MSKPVPGITTKHARACPVYRNSRDSNIRCACKPTYQVHLWDRREGKRIWKTFPTLSAAKAWRQDALPELRRGTMRAPTQTTLRQAWEAWQVGAKEGTIRNRSGDAYKPSSLRGYEEAMRLRVLEDLGSLKLSEVTRVTLQDLVDRLLAKGLDASTIRNTLMPLRAVYRRAVSRGDVAFNPTAGLSLPAVRGRRDRIASPAEAATLLAALEDERDRAVWATALYAGLRLGELRALRDEDVDLPAGVIRVERSWDKQEGVIEPKSRAGRRKVPIVATLRAHLAAHTLRRATSEGLFFGYGDQPFNRDHLAARANTAWKEAGLAPIGLHEARHTCASIFIAAGVNLKALSSYLGHASITITLDRYGHLMPGSQNEAVGLVDSYLERECATIAPQS
jgi:integrase